MSSEQPFYSGYNIEHEPRALIKARAADSTALWRAAAEAYTWEKPEELDPRGWFNIEDQQQTNSCVGQSLSACAEFSNVITQGEEVQLSRSWSYLASQEASGYLGRDNGADLNGATTAGERGIPLETDFPWAGNYSTMINLYRQKKAAILAGPLFKLMSEVIIDSAEAAIAFLGGWTGALHLGISWPGFTLQGGWEIHNYSGGGSGGHAITIPGYLKMTSWPEGYGFLLMNSWNVNWGRNGWALVKPAALTQMARNRNNIIIGRSQMVSPVPRPNP